MRLVVRVDSATGNVVVETAEKGAAPAREKDPVLCRGGTVALPVREEVRRIAVVCAEALGLQPEWLRKSGRMQIVAFARQLTWWLVRRRTTLSYPQIGLLFAKHHTTVLAALQRHGHLFEQGGAHAELAALLEARLDAAREHAPRPAPALIDHDPGD